MALRRDLELDINVPIHIWIITTECRFAEWCKLIENPWKPPVLEKHSTIAQQRAAIKNVTFSVMVHTFELRDLSSFDTSGKASLGVSVEAIEQVQAAAAAAAPEGDRKSTRMQPAEAVLRS